MNGAKSGRHRPLRPKTGCRKNLRSKGRGLHPRVQRESRSRHGAVRERERDAREASLGGKPTAHPAEVHGGAEGESKDPDPRGFSARGLVSPAPKSRSKDNLCRSFCFAMAPRIGTFRAAAKIGRASCRERV